MKLSVIIPVFNEEKNVRPLYSEISESLADLSSDYELIFINDGSTDNTITELESLKNITIIDLNRNYGQAVALDAGFKTAQGEVVISLDGDGQNDPADIPRLINLLEKENLDVVAGWRKKRKDANHIRLITRVAHLLRRLFIGDVVHDSGCTLRVYRREAIKSLDIGGEMHRYIMTLLRWKGFRIGELEVSHRPRTNGKSKYGLTKAVRGLIDLVYVWFIYKYSQRPLHLFGYMSFTSLLLSAVSLFVSIYGKVILEIGLNRNGWFFIGFFFLLTSIMFFSFGIIIDLLIRIQLTSSPYEKRYYIRRVIKNK